LPGIEDEEASGKEVDMRILPTITAAVALTALAGCMDTAPVQDGMQADARLQQMLAGKTAGAAVSCIPRLQAMNARPLVTPSSIAFTAGGTVYVSNVDGSGCADAANPNYSLITSSTSSDLCSGDRVELKDLQTGGFHGACVLSDFVPYRMR
jgi:hypothetical protein